MATQSFSEQSLPQAGHRKVLRYKTASRIMHALLATSFLLLLFTGLVIFLPFLSEYAAGGLSRLLHRVGAVIFIAVPVLYLIMDRSGTRELLRDSFHFDKDDVNWMVHSYRYFMGHTADMPPQGRLNAGQKIHHAGVVIFSGLVVFSGLALWIGKGELGPTNLAIAASIHGVAMLTLTVLLVGHIYFTVVYKALSGMTSGYINEEEARMEHAKWIDELHEKDGVLRAD